MSRGGVWPDVIEKGLDHLEQNRLVRTCQRQMLLKEQNNACRPLGDRLELLIGGVENVFPLARKVKQQA